jgi:hypothetical protein
MIDAVVIIGVAFPAGFVVGMVLRDIILQPKIYDLKVQIRRLEDRLEDYKKWDSMGVYKKWDSMGVNNGIQKVFR